jgi:hypothetical protein
MSKDEILKKQNFEEKLLEAKILQKHNILILNFILVFTFIIALTITAILALTLTLTLTAILALTLTLSCKTNSIKYENAMMKT